MKTLKVLFTAAVLLIALLSLTTVEVDNSKDYNDSDLMKHYIADEYPIKSSLEIKDRKAAVYLGEFLFSKPASITGVSCASCHSTKNSFYPNEIKPSGDGGYKTAYNQLHLYLYNKISHIPLDQPDLRSPTAINSALVDNMLWGGELGFEGLNKDVDQKILMDFNKANTAIDEEAQAGAGHDGHLMEGLVMECRHDNSLQEAALKAYGKTIDLQVVLCAISAFEQTLLTNNNRVNQVIRGKRKRLASYEGLKLYNENCYSCHNRDTLVYKIAKSEFEGRFRMTKDSSDYGLVKVPRIENVKDAKGLFHADIDVGYIKAMNMHREITNHKGEILDYIPKLTRKQKGAIQKFNNRDLYDEDVLN